MSAGTMLGQVFVSLPFLALVAYIIQRINFRRRSRGYSLPPSRPGYPILGNALELPKKHEFLTYDKWAKELGSNIFTINAAGTYLIVLNSFELATQMLEQRAAIYSSRPTPVMLELIGWDWAFVLLPHNERWRERRKLFQRHFNPSNKFYQRYAQEWVSRLIGNLAETPKDFRRHITETLGGLAVSMVYGLDVQPHDDPIIERAESAIRVANTFLIPGASWVDMLPILRFVPEWMPGAGFQALARKGKAITNDMLKLPFIQTEKQMLEGTAPTSFVSEILEREDGVSREVKEHTAGMVYAAATETTASAMETFFLAMTCYSDVQKRGQQELDRVLGADLPDFGDQERLPYITAILEEVLRWHPAFPFSVPHASSQDDVFNEYFIPKGSVIIPNTWAILHDEKEYPEPDQFIPERFLKGVGHRGKVSREPGLAFGYGRRVCPGAHIARSTLW